MTALAQSIPPCLVRINVPPTAGGQEIAGGWQEEFRLSRCYVWTLDGRTLDFKFTTFSEKEISPYHKLQGREPSGAGQETEIVCPSVHLSNARSFSRLNHPRIAPRQALSRKSNTPHNPRSLQALACAANAACALQS